MRGLEKDFILHLVHLWGSYYRRQAKIFSRAALNEERALM